LAATIAIIASGSMGPMRLRYVVPLAAFAAGAAGLGYATWEARAFRLRCVAVPVLPPRARPLRLLHISDLHLISPQRRKQRWLRSLAELHPDLVINTGDNVDHPDAVDVVLDVLAPLLERPGAFVFGNHDYYGPVWKNPLRYLLPGGSPDVVGKPLPWQKLRDSFTAAGWVDLTNAQARLTIARQEIQLVGVDDPYLNRDRYDEVAGPADSTAEVRLGMMHAPYTRVLDRMTRDGYQLILAGHTHGGQLRLPGYGAVVANCDLDRHRVKGLSRYSSGNRQAWLHVSSGIGASPYVPLRFACPPEATLLTLMPRK